MLNVDVNLEIIYLQFCRMYGTVKYVTVNPAVDLVCLVWWAFKCSHIEKLVPIHSLNAFNWFTVFIFRLPFRSIGNFDFWLSIRLLSWSMFGICKVLYVSQFLKSVYFQRQLLRFCQGFSKSSMRVELWKNFYMLICPENIRTPLVKSSWTMQKPYRKAFLTNFALSGMVNFGLFSLQT